MMMRQLQHKPTARQATLWLAGGSLFSAADCLTMLPGYNGLDSVTGSVEQQTIANRQLKT
jgi:hypothetical protein